MRRAGEIGYYGSTKDEYLYPVQLLSVKTLQLSPKEHKGDRLNRSDCQGELKVYKGLKEEEWQVPRTEKYSV